MNTKRKLFTQKFFVIALRRASLYVFVLLLLGGVDSSQAGIAISGNNYKVSRSEFNVRAAVESSSSHRALTSAGAIRTKTFRSNLHAVHPGVANLICHPDAITSLTGLQTATGEVTLTWSSPRVIDGQDSGSGRYNVRWSSSQALTSESAFNQATEFNFDWAPLSAGQTETNRIITGLPEDTTIYFSIKAQDVAGNRAYVSQGTASENGIYVASKFAPIIEGFTVFATSLTVSLGRNGNAPNTLLQISSQNFMVSNTSGGVVLVNAGPTVLSLQGLTPNTPYTIYARTQGSDLTTSKIVNVVESTRTHALTPGAPTIQSLGFTESYIALNNNLNPVSGSNSTLFAIYVKVNFPPNSSHDNTYIPASKNMDNASTQPLWQTYQEWGGTTGFIISNLIGGSAYSFQVKAKNQDGIETALSESDSVFTAPLNPEIVWKSGQAEDSWTNVSTNSFSAKNSSHYHYRFNQDPDDTKDVSSADPAFTNSQIILVNANGDGPWYMHVMGDNYGFLGNTQHSKIGQARYKINVDRVPPLVENLAASFGPQSTNKIQDNLKTPHKEPFFTWVSKQSKIAPESPIVGYSFTLSTGIDAGDPAVPQVVKTTQPYAFFNLANLAERSANIYYFRVKALDAAGNWGQSALFTYRVREDSDKPRAEVKFISNSQGADGRYLGVKSSSTFSLEFTEDMNPETVIEQNNVTLIGVRDNFGKTTSVQFSAKLSYNTTSNILSYEPNESLPKGWLFKLAIGTNILDLGGNALSQSMSVNFETVMDHKVDNSFTGDDGVTKVFVPSNAFPDDASLSITLVSGGVSSTKNNTAPSLYAAHFGSQQAIENANTKLSQILGPYAQAVTIREFTAVKEDGSLIKSNFNSPVTITVPYVDDNDDGYIDGTNPKVKASKQQIYVLDENTQNWMRISNTTVNSENKTLTANVMHFSIYAAISNADAAVEEAYAYPVPFKPALGHTQITFANLPTQGTISIYTLSGNLLKSINFLDPANGKTYWDATNDEGKKVGSGVYHYVVESGENRKLGKLMVVR